MQSVWCLERLQWGIGNCESVRQADCVEIYKAQILQSIKRAMSPVSKIHVFRRFLKTSRDMCSECSSAGKLS